MITWTPISTTLDHYTHGDYLFKRIGKPYRYELWSKGALLDNTITDEFQIGRIVAHGYESSWRKKQR